MLPVTVQRPHEGSILEIIVLGFAEESDHFRSRRMKGIGIRKLARDDNGLSIRPRSASSRLSNPYHERGHKFTRLEQHNESLDSFANNIKNPQILFVRAIRSSHPPNAN
jgi:hypothetical protein